MEPETIVPKIEDAARDLAAAAPQAAEAAQNNEEPSLGERAVDVAGDLLLDVVGGGLGALVEAAASSASAVGQAAAASASVIGDVAATSASAVGDVAASAAETVVDVVGSAIGGIFDGL